MDDFVCQANTNGTEYFFFEYFDEPWKDQKFGGVEVSEYSLSLAFLEAHTRI